eukprot:1808748-Alexandrium_andersonii.AAC.1
MTGPGTRFPLTFVSQKQRSVSHSTPEAEIVAVDHVLRAMLLPSLTLRETLLGRKVAAYVCEDNQAFFRLLNQGPTRPCAFWNGLTDATFNGFVGDIWM